MQTILTKYLPATNTRGARIKAVQSGWSDKRECNSVTIPYPHELSGDETHAVAARLLAEKLGWHGEMVCGSLGAWSEFANVFVFVDRGSNKFQF